MDWYPYGAVPLNFARIDRGDLSSLRIMGTLDINTAPELGKTIDQLVAQRRLQVTVDLSGLDKIDSSGAAALVALAKRLGSIGGKVQVTNAVGQPLAVFKMLRVDTLFGI